MYCRKCGTELGIDGKCPNCGEYDSEIIRVNVQDGSTGAGSKKQKKAKKKGGFGKVIKVIVIAFIALAVIGAISSGGEKKKSSGSGTLSPLQTTAPATLRPTTQPAAQSEATAATEAPVQTEEPASTETPAQASGIRPEFQTAMDEYKEFFRQYAEFMQKFSSDPNAMMTMMGDYMTFMTQYTETMEAMDAIDEGELTPEEDALYLQTMLEIDNMLIGSIS